MFCPRQSPCILEQWSLHSMFFWSWSLSRPPCQAYFPIFLSVISSINTFPILPLMKSSPTFRPPQLFTIASTVTCITACLHLVPSNTTYVFCFPGKYSESIMPKDFHVHSVTSCWSHSPCSLILR